MRAQAVIPAALLLAGAIASTVPGAGYRLIHARVPMRDGIRLDTNIFLPSGAARFPSILARTPYGKGTSLFAGYKTFIDHGYAVVIQDIRGRYGSQGSFNGFAIEGKDGSDTIDWIARQAWSDGNVAMSGGSYLGFVQWEAALENNPHLKAIFPAVSGSDPYLDRYYSPGGAFQFSHRLSWLAANLALPGFHAQPLRVYVNHLPPRTADRAATGRSIAAYQKMMDHPSYDSFWRRMNLLKRLGKMRAPVFAMDGWYDTYAEGSLAAYRELNRLGRHPRLIVGPWPHNMSIGFRGASFGPRSSAPIRRYEWQWFDHVVKSPPSSAHEEFTGPLRIFVMGVNRWRDETEWPPARARSELFYLGPSGALVRSAPRESAPDVYRYDPRNPTPTRGGAVCCDPSVLPWGPMDQRPIERRADVLVYSTPVLGRDLEVTGPIRLVVYASTSARDTDFTAKLVDVFPDGEARNLTDGILRLRYRNGLDRPELAKPGEIYELAIDAGVTSNVFLAGHRIRLEVASANFPRFDRNPNTGSPIADEVSLRAALQTIYHDRAHPSSLVLPVVSGK